MRSKKEGKKEALLKGEEGVLTAAADAAAVVVAVDALAAVSNTTETEFEKDETAGER